MSEMALWLPKKPHPYGWQNAELLGVTKNRRFLKGEGANAG
jgi:hypothetical protein